MNASAQLNTIWSTSDNRLIDRAKSLIARVSRLVVVLLLTVYSHGAQAGGRNRAAAPEADGLQMMQAEVAADKARLLAAVGPTETLKALRSQTAPVTTSMSLPVLNGVCDVAIRDAETAAGTYPGLLRAIAQVESGRTDASGASHPWPWTVNADGVGRFFPDRAKAVAWVRETLSHGATAVDVGCMQIDLQQHPGAFSTVEESFDPVLNTHYAARFLKSLWAADPSHDWMIAAGFYHSHTASLADTYRRHVAAWTSYASKIRMTP